MRARWNTMDRKVTDFSAWERTTLERFAREAADKLQEQADQLEQLRGDLKTAIEAYRDLVRKLKVTS